MAKRFKEELTHMKKIEQKIYLIRGTKVMLDKELAELYEVTVGRLNEAVKRNHNRFPPDFMFQLTEQEAMNLKSQFAISSSGRGRSLRSQFVTSKKGWGGRRHYPYAFTEQGIAMLSSVLNSERAIQVNIQIMRAFIRSREFLATHESIKKKIESVERKFSTKFKKHDKNFRVIFEVIRQILEPPQKPKPRIGFQP